jgi:hypothetical protein
MYVSMYVCMYVCVYVYMHVRMRVYACRCLRTYVRMYVCTQHTKSASVHDQIRICHFLKQQLLLLQFTLQIMIEMYLPKPTILRATQCDSQPKQ